MKPPGFASVAPAATTAIHGEEATALIRSTIPFVVFSAKGRRQVREYHRFLRDRVPGFERSVLVATSPAIGVRESRRVIGDYRLTRDDVLGSRRFQDEIALCGAPIEDHAAGPDTRWTYVPESGVYGIPYRCLLPQGVEGMLVAGRCFSATHDAHASARSMATCMAMGQAAGTAAAQSVRSKTTPRSVDVAELRSCLLENHALLDPIDGVGASS